MGFDGRKRRRKTDCFFFFFLLPIFLFSFSFIIIIFLLVLLVRFPYKLFVPFDQWPFFILFFFGKRIIYRACVNSSNDAPGKENQEIRGGKRE